MVDPNLGAPFYLQVYYYPRIEIRPCVMRIIKGPDYMRDHRVRVEEQYYVGHGSMSPEASGNTNYICRAAPVS